MLYVRVETICPACGWRDTCGVEVQEPRGLAFLDCGRCGAEYPGPLPVEVVELLDPMGGGQKG